MRNSGLELLNVETFATFNEYHVHDKNISTFISGKTTCWSMMTYSVTWKWERGHAFANPSGLFAGNRFSVWKTLRLFAVQWCRKLTRILDIWDQPKKSILSTLKKINIRVNLCTDLSALAKVGTNHLISVGIDLMTSHNFPLLEGLAHEARIWCYLKF